jgi:predicted PurR-regulated permease PerM
MDERTRQVAQGVAIGGGVILGAASALVLFVVLAEVLGILFLGVVLGITLAPLAERGQRYRIPRIISGLMVYAVVAVAIVGFLWYAIPAAIDEMPTAEEFEEVVSWYEDLSDRTLLPPFERLTSYAEELLENPPFDAQQALAMVTALFFALAALVIALFVTITKDRAYDLFLSLVAQQYREPTARFMEEFARRLRRYVFATFLTMTAVGIMTYAGLLLLDVPFALPLAVLAFIFEIIPIVGPWIAFIPAFAIALTQGPLVALGVAVLYLVVQQVESYVIVPVIHGRETRMPGLLIISAIMFGFPLMGILGALLALPVALFLHSLTTLVLVPWRQGVLERRAAAAAEDRADGIKPSPNLPAPDAEGDAAL